MTALMLHRTPAAVAGTVLFLVFVAVKMRTRIACGAACCGAGGAAAADRERVLRLAATLYQAAAADPDFVSSPAASAWRPPPSPYTCPTLPPPEPRAAPPLARSPSAASSPGAEIVARSPWSRSSPASARPLGPLQPAVTPPATVAPPSRAGSPAQSQRSSPRPPRPSVRELIRAWTTFGSHGDRGARAAAAAAAAAEQAEAERAAGVAALEAGLACQPSAGAEARVLTWSQLGVSPAASRRTSENSVHGAGRRASLPHVPARPPAGADVHTNPMFAPHDWAAAAASAAEAGAAGSFSLRRAPSRSRLSRAASFVDPDSTAAPAAAAAEEGLWEGSSHGHHQRRHSGLHAPGGGMSSRPSDPCLLHLDRINE